MPQDTLASMCVFGAPLLISFKTTRLQIQIPRSALIQNNEMTFQLNLIGFIADLLT